MSNRNRKNEMKLDRRVEHVAERTKNMIFRIEMKNKDRNLYLGMAVAGCLIFLGGLVLYIYQMFTLHLGDLRYAVIVVGAGLGFNMIRGFIEFFRQISAKLKTLTSEQVTKGCDRFTNMGMAAGQVFLAVFLMEWLSSRSNMPLWVPVVTEIGALLVYSGGRMICDAVKPVSQAS